MPDGPHNPVSLDPAERAPWHRTGAGRGVLLGGLVLLLVAAGGWFVRYWTVGRFIEHTNNAYLQADAVVVSPKVSGYVTEVLVADNAAVPAGQPVVRIDGAPYQAAFDMATAEVAQRQADLVRFRAELARQDAARAEAQAQVAVAEAAARFAADDAARFERLASNGVAAAQRREQAEMLRAQTAGQLTAARAAVETASRGLDALRAQIGQGEAALAAAEAKVRAVQADLTGIEIAAPLAGTVGDRTVRVGQYVQPGTRLMTIVPVQDVYLVANFKETQVGRMRPGQPVAVSIDALPDARLSGRVDSLAPGTGAQFALLPPENATGNFTKIVQRVPVRIRLEAEPALRAALRPGLSAVVEVDTRAAP
jgi:membrane fusion protein (multidrug efflux system)